MKHIEDMTREDYIEWLIAYMGYSYENACKMADFMQIEKDGNK